MESDPIHGSLGPPGGRKIELTPEEKLEEELRQYRPITYEHEHDTVVDTNNSIKIAETITGNKMAEPYDIEKRNKILGNPEAVKYQLHDSDDEDPETYETRRSLRTAERMLQHRFFTNDTDRQLYEKRKANGTLRKVAQRFEENDDHTTATEGEVKAKEQAKKYAKAVAENEKLLEEQAAAAKKKV
jgi:hypothetical protein